MSGKKLQRSSIALIAAGLLALTTPDPPAPSGDGGGSRSYSRSQRPKAERAAESQSFL